MGGTWKKPFYRGAARTRLEHLIRAYGLFPGRVTKIAEIARDRLLLYRIGAASPTLSTIRRLVRGFRALTRNPTITANDLFALDDDDA
jgi:hypothetical protein